MGIVEFLEARIAEDEAVAKNVASAGEWTSGSTYGMFVSVEARCGTVVSGEWERQDANHIARHDPARVLREVAAKRAIIEAADEASDLDMSIDNDRRVGRRDMTEEPYLGDVILRALAASYADHPDFDEEWRP